MINDIRSTVILLEQKHKRWENSQKTSQPGTQHKQGAEFPVHDGCVVKGLTDGNIAVIGHGSQEIKFCDSQQKIEKQLSCTIIIRNSFVSSHNGCQESGNTHCCEHDFQKGEITEKEIHWSFEARVQQGEKHND